MRRLLDRLAVWRLRQGEAAPQDAPAMALLHAGAFARGWTAPEIAALMRESGVMAPAVWRGSALLAFAIGRVVTDEAEVLTLMVAPAARRRGLGARLLAALEARAAAAGAARMFLDVSERNAAALALYDRAAYRQVGRRPGYYEDGAAARTMRKDLPASESGRA